MLSWILLAVLLLILLIYPVKAVISDFWYHLAVAKAITIDGMIPSHDWWSFQPLGRPHFYPPLIHLLISITGKLGSDAIIAAHRLGSMLYIACLFSSWLLYRYFWGPAVAFVGVALLTTNFIFTISATSLMPAALISLILPLLMIELERKELVGVSLLLTASLFAHGTMPWLLILGTVVYLWKHKTDRKRIVGTVALALLLASPWLFHVARSVLSVDIGALGNSDQLPGIGPFHILSHYVISIPLFLLALYGIWKTRKHKTAGLTLTRIFCIVFIPLLIFYGGRYFWHLVPLFVVFAIVPFEKQITAFFSSFSWQKTVVTLACSSILLIPTINFSWNAKGTEDLSINTEWTAIDLAFLDTENETSTAVFQEMTRFITKNTHADTILDVDNPATAEMLFIITGRRTNNGQFWESATATSVIGLPKPDSGIYGAFVYKHGPLPDSVPVDIVQSFGEYTVAIANS